MTHTKERWIVSGKYINSTQGISVCMMMGKSNTDKANARLIASAPDLLEALEELLPYAKGNYDAEIKAVKAIKKARAQ